MEAVDLNPVSDEIAKASKQATRDGSAAREAQIANIVRDAIHASSKPLPNGASTQYGEGAFGRLSREAQKASRLRQQVARVIRRADKDSWARRLSAGRLDRRAFARIGAGDTANPYARHSFSPGYETEITIVLDGSSSMASGAKLDRATALALVVAQAAEQVGVKCEIVRFVCNNVVSVKAPRERLGNQAVQLRLGNASQTASGSTPLTQTLALCAKRLAVRAPTKRKMIFAVTDGACDCGPEAVRKIADHCDGLGVEVIGLSIDSPVQSAFRFEAAVNSSDDVSKAGLGVLVKALENRPGYASAAR